ncbi:MAG: Flavoprotein, partial [Verrucomicrobiota bacterium]
MKGKDGGRGGRNVVLGVTGSIAAHRGLDLASALTKAGCRVQVVLT